MNDPVTEAVVTAAEHVPKDLLLLGAFAVETAPEWSAAVHQALVDASPAPLYCQHA